MPAVDRPVDWHIKITLCLHKLQETWYSPKTSSARIIAKISDLLTWNFHHLLKSSETNTLKWGSDGPVSIWSVVNIPYQSVILIQGFYVMFICKIRVFTKTNNFHVDNFQSKEDLQYSQSIRHTYLCTVSSTLIYITHIHIDTDILNIYLSLKVITNAASWTYTPIYIIYIIYTVFIELKILVFLFLCIFVGLILINEGKQRVTMKLFTPQDAVSFQNRKASLCHLYFRSETHKLA